MPPYSDRQTAMTDAERQAGCRAARAAGKPATRLPRRLDRRSRAQRWHDAAAELAELQASYAAWLDTVPDNTRDGATAQALQAISDIDLADLQEIDPPRGFGRD